MKKIVFFFLFLPLYSIAQLSGLITDTSGEPLAFASVYIDGTSRGTTSNVDGEYELNLDNGTYDMVFQYIGYQQQIVSVTIDNKPFGLDVELAEESVNLSEIVVRADAEDPAYAVIRKAIEKRTYYRDLIQAYACDTYVKGNQKLLDAPEKILGQEIGDLGGTLDTNRQGIVYLSESQSKLYYQYPKKKKEIMISSKVSGDDNGFSFNRASLMDFSFYENTIDLNRPIISPIANSALSYYRYKLVGTLYDEKNRLINKIEVLPKRENDPVFSGFIYIVEDLWNIQSAELAVTGKNIQQPILDTLILKQTHIPIDDSDKWVLLSQVIDFKVGIFGFKFKGVFTGIFSNYDLNPNLSADFFTNEVFKVEDEANEKDSVYWESIRPIPLTEEEGFDYVKKDSLQMIWESKPFMDSIDQVNNKFKFGNLIGGYTYNRSYQKKFFSIESPLFALQYNTIQGLTFNLDIDYRHELDDDRLRWYEIKPILQYGLSDKQLRGQLEYVYHFNRTNYAQLGISGGRILTQFNDKPAISSFLNLINTLLYGQNYLKAYDKSFGKINYQQELVNGIFMWSSLEYGQKKAVVNTTDYSFVKNPTFSSNDPLVADNFGNSSFDSYNSLILDLRFRFRINQKFLTYPNRKFNEGSKYPDFWLSYRKGFKALGADANFDLLRLAIEEKSLSTGRFGYFSFNVEAGLFLNKKQVDFPDYYHFNGNQPFSGQFAFGNPSNYQSSFLLLPYYTDSTNDKYIQLHAEQYLSGFLLDKIPLIRKLGWQTVLGASFLYTPLQKDYLELNFGLDNIGFKAFRLLRVDFVANFRQGKQQDWGIIIGLKL